MITNCFKFSSLQHLGGLLAYLRLRALKMDIKYCIKAGDIVQLEGNIMIFDQLILDMA